MAKRLARSLPNLLPASSPASGQDKILVPLTKTDYFAPTATAVSIARCGEAKVCLNSFQFVYDSAVLFFLDSVPRARSAHTHLAARPCPYLFLEWKRVYADVEV